MAQAAKAIAHIAAGGRYIRWRGNRGKRQRGIGTMPTPVACWVGSPNGIHNGGGANPSFQWGVCFGGAPDARRIMNATPPYEPATWLGLSAANRG